MTITIPKPQKMEQIPAGTYIARCYSMIHIGTVAYEWKGEMNKSNKVRITFELPTETKVFKEGEEPKPLVISREFSLSLGSKSKFGPFLEGWRGRKFTEEEKENFDITKLIGVPAMISVIHNEKGYAEIASASSLPKGISCPPQVNPSQILEYDNWNQELFEKQPQFIKDKIVQSDEYKALKCLEQPMDSQEVLDSSPF